MNAPRSTKKRIDYQILNSSGDVVLKDSEDQSNSDINTSEAIPDEKPEEVATTSEVHTMQGDDSIKKESEVQRSGQSEANINKLLGQVEALNDDIADFIDENPVSDIPCAVEDLDQVIKKMEDLRSGYRSKHKELLLHLGDEYGSDLKSNYHRTLDDVKEYIKAAQLRKKDLRGDEDLVKSRALLLKDEKLVFLRTEIKRVMNELETVFVDYQIIKQECDEDIIKRKKELTEQVKKIDNLSKSIHQMIDLREKATEIRITKARYDKLLVSKDTYVTALATEEKSREIEKQKKFNQASLGIKLGKFKGYNSSLDTYTFQDQFEKVHLKDTPTALLPDLLKNNFLEGAALSLVKNVTEIDDIWKRLKDAYGDCKIMLSKKMSEFNSIGDIWRQRDPSKTVEGLSKIINLMRDLLQLVKRHKIENNLYYGGAIDNVYHLMGHGRLNRWLTDKKAEDDGEGLWLELIQFLEKELKVCQQTAIIMASKASAKPKEPSPKPTQPTYVAGLTHHASTPIACSLCDATDHVQTNGPGGIKVVQYFSCKKFSEASCAQRLNFIFSKGFCIQCLFPGADGSKGKHKEGKCQRDFVCPHPSHANFQVKKQLLLCDDHKDSQENKQLLQNYKTRCILKQRDVDLPAYAKNIQLYFASPTKINCVVSDRENESVITCKKSNEVNPAAEVIQETPDSHMMTDNDNALTDMTQNNNTPQTDLTLDHAVLSDVMPDNETFLTDNVTTVDKAITGSQDSTTLTDKISGTYSNVLDDDGFIQHEENGIYILQTIKDELDQTYSIFYDGGCGKFCSRYSACQRLGSRAKQIHKGIIPIHGVGGGVAAEATHGVYSVKLPLADGGDAVLAGACLDQITETFPSYPLQNIENDIMAEYRSQVGYNSRKLPDLPTSVGGDTDFMIGITYSRYLPREIFRTVSGLIMYESCFKNVDGSRGVVGGPHWVITEIDQRCHFSAKVFLTAQAEHYFKYGFQINPDVSLLGYKDEDMCHDDDDYEESALVMDDNEQVHCRHCIYVTNPRVLKRMEEVENAGSAIDYRCIKCRNCKECKSSEHIRAVSIKEEVEQDVLEGSVEVNIEEGQITASLPIIGDPTIRLVPNRDKAMATYQRQINHSLKNLEDKKALIASERKLQDLGFVAWVNDLPEEDQKMLADNVIQNYIPWRVVYKESSTTTPCRLVFDASQPTASGYSLNDMVPKGINMLNKMIEIYLRWRTYPLAFHCDVQKMYNRIKLKKEYWCFQRYLFQKDLDPNEPPDDKVILSVIYGVRLSGNQAQVGLHRTAEVHKEEFPEVYEIICKDTYMDDCMSGEYSEHTFQKRQNELESVLLSTNLLISGFTVSGKDPDKSLSSDGVSIPVAGYNWYSKEDSVSLATKPLNFARKKRGRKAEMISEIPKQLTKLDCASKYGEIYDPAGLLVPLRSGMKVDLHLLNKRKLKWDATLPNEYHAQWKSHFEMITEMKNIRFHRAVIPPDATSLEISTLDFGDASVDLACVAVYVRYKLRNGEYSCQLIFAKSKLVPDLTQPRAELFAALNNAHAGEVVRRALSKFHRRSTKFTDSQIALFWICNSTRALKPWVKNRVIDALRFTELEDWFYIDTKDMIADLGTRPCTNITLVGPESDWINGYEWMKKEESEFPMMSASDIILSNQEAQLMKKELQEVAITPSYLTDTWCFTDSYLVSKDITERYMLSDYLVDPNRWRFSTVINVVALVFRFKKNIQDAVKRRRELTSKGLSVQTVAENDMSKIIPLIIISDEEINAAKRYYFQKATTEVKTFLKPSKYKNISVETDGVMKFSGRILPTDDVSIVGRATQVMKDLSATTFAVPLVDKNSPIAYSVVNDIHWYHPTAQHRGIDTTWRYVLKEIYIIDGHSLVTKIKDSCERCRYLLKKSLEVSMGPISPHTLTIAPAFFATQLDIVGPFTAHCHLHKRNTIKIWFVVYVCSTTSTTSIKVMDDYSATAFLQSFVRFSSEVGYPKTLLCDEGSQLVKGCESMTLTFRDLQHQLHRDVGVDLEVCPVGGHNMNGRVERKIREIRKSMSTTLTHKKLSVLQWETLASSISNSLNNMPLALGNSKSNLDSLDILTPNRLRLGRNNERSPDGNFSVGHYDKIIEENAKIFDSWFEIWLTVHVPRLLDQQKWYRSDEELKEGDIVLFLKNESELSSTYQYGMVEEVEVGRDRKVRKVRVKYRNASEKIDCTTYRAVRSLVLIRRANESSVMEELGEISRYVESTRNKCTSTVPSVTWGSVTIHQ